jgi:hypothetical protein
MRQKKRKIKENEAKTVLLIENFKASKNQLTKSRDQYHHQSAETDKLKQLLDTYQQQSPPNQALLASLNANLAKLDKKTTTLMEEYKSNVDKYNLNRIDFEQRFLESCHMFQLNEEAHLNRMRVYLLRYLDAMSLLNQSRQKDSNDFRAKLNNKFTSDYLIQQFIAAKASGKLYFLWPKI